MDRIDRLLRGANPVPDDSKPPIDPAWQLRLLLLPGPDESHRSADTRPEAGRRRLLPAVVAIAAMLGLAVVAAFAVTTWPHPARPVSGQSSTATWTPDGWRLTGYPASPDAGSETYVRLTIPPDWGFGWTAGDPDYPANGGYLFAPVPGAADGPDFTRAAVMIYYGPMGPRYDPGACGGPQESYAELDSSPVNIPYDPAAPGTVPPRFVYRVKSAGNSFVASFGITTRPAGASIDSCSQFFQIRAARPGYYFAFSSYAVFSGANPGWVTDASGPASREFGSLEDARAFLATSTYQDIKRMFSSITVTAP